jgi:stage V sporulation protein S
MDAKDIMTLTAAFVAAAENVGNQSTGGMSASAMSLTNPGLAQQQMQQQQLQQKQQQQQQMLANGVDGGLDLGSAGFTIDGNAGMMLDPLMQQQALQQKQQLPTLADVVGTLQTVKVSAKTNVKSIAGAMSKALRTCEAFVATSVGPDGVNHAMKALCIARCYLAAEGLDLTATVTEVQPDVGISTGQCYAFIVVRIVVPAKPGPWASAGVGRTLSRNPCGLSSAH